MTRLQERYEKDILPQLATKCGRTNRLALPKLQKIVVSMGFGRAATQGEKVKVEEAQKHMASMSGQKPLVTMSKTSIAGFKLRENMKIGCKVTLRGRRMYEFLDRFINVALPRVRDFRGVSSKSFDGAGNYNLGINDDAIFPEIDQDKVQITQGLNLTFVVKNASDDESRELLKLMGMPFRHQ